MKRKGWIIISIIIGCVAAINLIAWNSTAFCDFYVKHIFPLWINTYGRLTGLFPFSVGEVMIAAGIFITVFALILGIFWTAVLLFTMRRHNYSRFRQCCRKFCLLYYKAYGCILTAVAVIMTLNCFILYHCSTFSEKYMPSEKEDYALEELTLLRNYVVTQANSLAKQVQRDQDGRVIYTDNMENQAILSMQRLGEDYEQLKGFYPKPKELKASEFLSQQYMQGYFFPFSMEANYNGVMYTTNKPVTMCHELAHMKGFIYEDEANLIGFLACINSEDPTFQYSGYLSVLNYIDNDYYESIGKNKQLYKEQVKISPEVKKDNVFLTKDAWVKVEQKAVVKTAVVAKISDEFLETNLVLNGVSDGILSYSRVVGLLLDYYDGNYGIMMEEEYLVQGE